MFKLGTALVVAVAAAAMVMLSALIHDARISVVLLRGLTGFLISGLVVYGLAVLFEKLEFPKLWRGISEEERQRDLKNQRSSNGDEADNSPRGDGVAGADALEHTSEENDDSGFKPLKEEDLQRIIPPDDSQQ